MLFSHDAKKRNLYFHISVTMLFLQLPLFIVFPRYIYKRLAFLGNRNISMGLMLVFISLWHGIHPSYLVVFLGCEFPMVLAERQVRRLSSRCCALCPFYSSFPFILAIITLETTFIRLFMAYIEVLCASCHVHYLTFSSDPFASWYDYLSRMCICFAFPSRASSAVLAGVRKYMWLQHLDMSWSAPLPSHCLVLSLCQFLLLLRCCWYDVLSLGGPSEGKRLLVSALQLSFVLSDIMGRRYMPHSSWFSVVEGFPNLGSSLVSTSIVTVYWPEVKPRFW